MYASCLCSKCACSRRSACGTINQGAKTKAHDTTRKDKRGIAFQGQTIQTNMCVQACSTSVCTRNNTTQPRPCHLFSPRAAAQQQQQLVRSLATYPTLSLTRVMRGLTRVTDPGGGRGPGATTGGTSPASPRGRLNNIPFPLPTAAAAVLETTLLPPAGGVPGGGGRGAIGVSAVVAGMPSIDPATTADTTSGLLFSGKRRR